MVVTALPVVVSPAPFHNVLLVVVSVAEALVAEVHYVFLSVVVASHSFLLRTLILLYPAMFCRTGEVALGKPRHWR